MEVNVEKLVTAIKKLRTENKRLRTERDSYRGGVLPEPFVEKSRFNDMYCVYRYRLECVCSMADDMYDTEEEALAALALSKEERQDN